MFFNSYLMTNHKKRDTVDSLYQKIVGISRNKVFYTKFKIPDTLDGRYDLLALFSIILTFSLSKSGKKGVELSQVLLTEKALKAMPNWKEFVLNFSLDVEEAFKTWSGQNELLSSSPQKALTILRQLGHDKTSMNQLVHLLNMSYNLSLEFKEIYRRLK